LDVSKAIDKQAGAKREIIGKIRNNQPGGTSAFAQGGIGSYQSGDTTERDVVGGPVTDEAKQWQGWGTALKPAHEPVVLARKPLDGTVANNVLQHGTGALNIDECRVGNDSVQTNRYNSKGDMTSFRGSQAGNSYVSSIHSGRWPANFIHDGSDEVTELFPDTAGGIAIRRNVGRSQAGMFSMGNKGPEEDFGYGDSGSAARFFYCAKANKTDRNEGLDDFTAKRDADRLRDDGVGEDNPRNRSNTAKVNHHPTVKPTTLMRYLVRLITPPDGLVLDPFTGSGSTGKAAIIEGFRFHGIEQDPDYVQIARARIGFVE
jgi:site-specific DNA-methyltransferase (adenine-specific)